MVVESLAEDRADRAHDVGGRAPERMTPLGGEDDQLAATASRLTGDLMLVGAAAAWALFSSLGRPLVAAVGAFRAILQIGRAHV